MFLVAVVDAMVRQGMLKQNAAGWEFVGNQEAKVVDIPGSLRQFIDQQLAQLPAADRELLEVASVAGAEFTAAAVAACRGDTEEVVDTRCDALARQGRFLRAQGPTVWPDGTMSICYGFLHDLYHEALYERVPASRRVRWHRQIGRRLEEEYGVQARVRAVELAEHFVRGRDTVRAVQYLRYAGEQAVQRSAHQEALQHLTQGLGLLATLPESPLRAQQELDMQIALGPALMAIRGTAAPEVEQTYARARTLCEKVGEMPQLLPTLWGLYRFYRQSDNVSGSTTRKSRISGVRIDQNHESFSECLYLNRGALPIARALGEQLDRWAQRLDAPTSRLEAHAALGGTLFFLGEYAAARGHLEQGIALIDSTAQRVLTRGYGEAPEVRCLGMAALTLWCLGYPTQAIRRSQEALALAQELAHIHSLTQAQHRAAYLHHLRREVPMVQAQAEALLTLATAQEFPSLLGLGKCWLGWALALQGQSEAGLTQLRQGMAAVLATGQTLSKPRCLVLLAEAVEHGGRVEDGLGLLNEALETLAANEQGDLLTEVYRLKGEFLLHQPFPDATLAEACFQQALTLARFHQAKSWELRAAMSLAQLWQSQGKYTEAYDLLTPVYEWFTEGFDTADLQEARALLDKLSWGRCGVMQIPSP